MSSFRLVLVAAIIYLGLLFSGYGVLIGSEKNAAGIGLQCKYLTARSVVTAQFINGENGIIGVSNCPLVKKIGNNVFE
ncbi:YobH family protein [Yersinia intermedia]|uniref:YobH family protein n=1 Tax=Yersinia intermedia TaxID=631 RepID=UPI0011A60A53|nr:YobH family protein [Yersinia intermedia]